MQIPSEQRNATTVRKATIAALAAVFAIAMTSFASLAASDFVGRWKVKDTEATLESSDWVMISLC
jgi:hypothetical protein